LESSDSEPSNPLSAVILGSSSGETSSEGASLQVNDPEHRENPSQGAQPQPIPGIPELEDETGNASKNVPVGLVLLPRTLTVTQVS
jgi:hypothetical protein